MKWQNNGRLFIEEQFPFGGEEIKRKEKKTPDDEFWNETRS